MIPKNTVAVHWKFSFPSVLIIPPDIYIPVTLKKRKNFCNWWNIVKQTFPLFLSPLWLWSKLWQTYSCLVCSSDPPSQVCSSLSHSVTLRERRRIIGRLQRNPNLMTTFTSWNTICIKWWERWSTVCISHEAAVFSPFYPKTPLQRHFEGSIIIRHR